MLYRLLSWLPFPVLYATARIAYLLLYYVAGYRKAVVRENLGKAFPEKNEKEITVLAKKFYLQLAQVALEIVKARRMNKADFRQRVKIVNPELMQRCSNDYQDSVILLTIHQGNWEWMLHGVTCAMNIPIDPVYKPLHNKTVDRLIFDIRSQFGSRPLSMARATRDILRHRREFRVFVMVADQSPVRRERSYWTEFMNQQAAVYTGAETIAKMTQFPVLFAQCRRRSRGHYELEFHELARPPYDKDSHAITDSYVRMAEQAIRSEPQSWLWSNRRWKRDLAQESKKHVT
ncbi:MAG TPA: lipid A biosynthesis (KDO)2-(lauroyl)-lipid IVA acyltransferase [Halieaceae bacterium]|nr:lipid A biosynthesis (KDO)2-(lauroyl)-lipid IVA acyltransferase [Halieaceae bacterium]